MKPPKRQELERNCCSFFDQQETYESLALQQFGASVAVGPALIKDRYHGVSFESRLDVPGLQAADLCAHCWHRNGTDEDTVGEEWRKALEVLTREAPGIKLPDAAHLEKILATLPPEMRATARATTDPNQDGSILT